MGFGVNGVMTNDPSMFCGRIEMMFPCMRISVKDKKQNECTYFVDCGKGFSMKYEWEEENKRIISVKIF